MLEFLSITLIIILAAMSPGPDFVLVTRNALNGSFRTGTMTALGVALGTFFHATYCILGFAVVIAKSILLFTIIKYIGAGYLIYLGITGLLTKKTASMPVDTPQIRNLLSSWQAARQGLLCNLLNPKAVLFFLALFTLMIKPSMPLSHQAGYAIEIAVIHFIWFTGVAAMFSHHYVKQFLSKFFHYLNRIFGTLLIGFGLKVGLSN